MLLHFLWNLTIFVITLGILITVHEFGHFLMARFFNVKVERFSIGFGPVLWRYHDSRNTEYVISIILIGGYVKLFNDQKDDSKNNIDSALYYKNIWKNVAIVIAGPIFNFIFSILLYTLVYIVGMPIHKPIIHEIIPNSIIAQSGISPGVEIKSVNNIRTCDWESVRLQFLNSIGKEKIIVSTNSINKIHTNTYIINLPKYWFNTYTDIKDPIIILGIIPDNIRMVPIISNIQSNSIAAHIGLKSGDRILSINDHVINNWNAYLTNIQNISEKNFRISVERKCKILYFNFILDDKCIINSDVIKKIIGISPKIVTFSTTHYSICQYRLHNAFFYACDKTWDLIYLIINTLIKLISGDIKIINIGGPIAIAKGAGNSAHFGLIYYLMFLAVMSINLGVVNLLPLPTLDGGHLIFLFLEKINGQPLSNKFKNLLYIIGFILLMLIMCFACFNDISKL